MIGQDKVWHFVIGGFLYAMSSVFQIQPTNMLTNIFAVGKEISDIHTTGFDVEDLVATIAGGYAVKIMLNDKPARRAVQIDMTVIDDFNKSIRETR